MGYAPNYAWSRISAWQRTRFIHHNGHSPNALATFHSPQLHFAMALTHVIPLFIASHNKVICGQTSKHLSAASWLVPFEVP
jgi:hypothetical protein